MDIKQLESFIAVVNERSFSKAAEKLYMTQPTITNHIQSLEAELETTLLNRTNRNITLTDAGILLFAHAQNIINIKNTAQFEMKEFKGNVDGHLEICSSSIPSQYVLPQVMKRFTDIYPNVTFSISQKNSKQVIEDIMSGHINYGIVGGLFDNPSLVSIDFLEDRLSLVSTGQRDLRRPSDSEIDLSSLLSEKFLLREEGSSTRTLIEHVLERHNILLSQLQTIATVVDNETLKQLVSLDVGLSFISDIAIKKEVELKLLNPYSLKDMAFNRKFYFVYHKNRYLSPLDQVFRDFIVRFAQSDALKEL